MEQLRDEADVERLSSLVAVELGSDGQRWFTPDGYDGLALCALDSIYSTGNRYSSVLRMLARYREASQGGGDPYADGPSDLLFAAQRWGGTDGFVAQTGYRWRVSTQPGAPFKAASALGAARVLQRAGLETIADVRGALTDRARQEASPVKKEWINLPGQRSGLTWTYFLMLAEVPGSRLTGWLCGMSPEPSDARRTRGNPHCWSPPSPTVTASPKPGSITRSGERSPAAPSSSTVRTNGLSRGRRRAASFRRQRTHALLRPQEEPLEALILDALPSAGWFQ